MNELDLTEAIEAGAAELWRDTNGDMPIRDCDAWQECLYQARRFIAAVVPIANRLIFRQLNNRIEDLEHQLRLARQHLDVCPTWQAVEEEDAAKRRADV